MYLQLFLADQLIDQRFVPNYTLYTHGYLQELMEEMLKANESRIESSEIQPRFIVEKKPVKQQKNIRRRIGALYNLLMDLF